ncbi:hypothetical protein MKW92_052871, partial [Papaver armeniacum]
MSHLITVCLLYYSILSWVCENFVKKFTLLDNLRWKLLKREEGRTLADFKYVCVGYSVHMDSKDKDPSTNVDAGARNPSNPQGKRSELPFCIGIELLVDKRHVAATASQAPGHVPCRAPAHAHILCLSTIIKFITL